MRTEERLSKWLLVGVPSFLGIGLLAAVILHLSFGVPLLSALLAAAALAGVQLAMYVPMYWVRQRFRKTQDLRLGVLVFGLYGLLLGSACIHFALQLGLTKGVRHSDYVEFPIYMVVVTALAVLVCSLVKPKQ
jgi:hypothetical protein